MNYISDVIRVISKPSEARSDGDVNSVVPWLRKVNVTLGDLDDESLAALIRGCSFEKLPANKVILKQGERSDAFYVVLRGTVSVFFSKGYQKSDGKQQSNSLGASMRKSSRMHRQSRGATDELPQGVRLAPLGDTTPFITESAVNGRDSETAVELWRASFGLRINSHESSSCFDERALAQADSVCRESIITDEECELLVVDRELYNRALTHHRELQTRSQREAVDNCYLFAGWFRKYRSVIESSLKKEVFEPNNPIIRQGDEVDKLVLIQSGMVQISTHSDLHRDQFEEFFTREIPKMKFDDDMASTMSKEDDQIASLYFKINIEESVRLSFKPLKTTDIAIIQQNSVIGDFEVCLSLSIHPFSYTALTRTVVYVLDRETLERVYNERNRFSPQFLNTTSRLVQTIEDRITNRFLLNSNLKEELLIFRRAITYINYLKYQVKKFQRRGQGTKSAPPDAATSTSQTQAGDTETEQLMKLYLANRMQLIRPCVKTAVADWTYHQTHRAHWRNVLRQKGKDKSVLGNTDPQARRPRSTRELRQEYGFTKFREVGLRPHTRPAYSDSSLFDDQEDEMGMKFDLDDFRTRVLASHATPEQLVAQYGQKYDLFDFEAFGNLLTKYRDSRNTQPVGTSRRTSVATPLASASSMRAAIAQSERQIAENNSEIGALENKIGEFLGNVQEFAHRKLNSVLTRYTDQRNDSSNAKGDKQAPSLANTAVPAKKSAVNSLKRVQLNPSKLPVRGTTVLMRATNCPCKTARDHDFGASTKKASDGGILLEHDHVRSFVVPNYVLDYVNTKDEADE